MTHKFIEDFATADIAFEASGKDLNELFNSSAEALFEILASTKKIGKSLKKTIKLSNENIEKLLYDFLSEILFHKDQDFMIFNSCKIEINKSENRFNLEATLYGEKINPKKT
ncbi:archease [Candidatus Woesearchaeota archaeon]|nr:archease [Candidatus Woesearchaeota archaeon]